MTEYGLEPAYGKLSYHSPYGSHSALIPTLAWLPSNITGQLGSYVAWDSVPRDGEDMWDTLIALLAPFHDPTTTYDLLQIFTKADENAPAIERVAKSLAVAGTSAAGGVRQAVQATFNFKTTGAQPLKLVFLDAPHGSGQFVKQTFATFNADALALFGELTSTASAWAGRDNTRPQSFLSVTYDLNDKLRKRYGMI